MSKTGLVSQWSFEEGSGTTVVDAIGANNGSIVGAASWAPGRYGQGLQLSGGYVNVPDSLSLSITGPFTIEAWVKPDAVTGMQGIAEKYDGSGTSGYILRMTSGKLGTIIAKGASAIMVTACDPVAA